MYYLDQNNDIQHFGTKGMKWGVRHDKQKQAVKSYREKIPGVTKQSKSAAKTFFKQDRTWNFRTYRKQYGSRFILRLVLLKISRDTIPAYFSEFP